MNNISKFRKQHSWSQSQFAEKMKVGRSTISMWETGATEPAFDQIIEMCSLFNVTPEVLMGQSISTSRNDFKIPVYDNYSPNNRKIVEYIEMYDNVDKNLFGIIANDNSMAPRIFKNDIVIIEPQAEIHNSEIYLVTFDNEWCIRKIKNVEDGIMLIPNNTSSETLYFSNRQIKSLPLQIVGKVIELRSKTIN